MPEVHFRVRWPDGSSRLCYSPSTIIRDHLAAGVDMPIEAFLANVRAGLRAASARVAQRYGTPCSIALREIGEIEDVARRQSPGGAVRIEFVG